MYLLEGNLELKIIWDFCKHKHLKLVSTKFFHFSLKAFQDQIISVKNALQFPSFTPPPCLLVTFAQIIFLLYFIFQNPSILVFINLHLL